MNEIKNRMSLEELCKVCDHGWKLYPKIGCEKNQFPIIYELPEMDIQIHQSAKIIFQLKNIEPEEMKLTEFSFSEVAAFLVLYANNDGLS